MAAITFRNAELDTDYPGSVVELPYGFGPIPVDNKSTFYFDIDNCLYNRSTKIHDLMQVSIHNYFKDSLSLDDAEAHVLHNKYYKEYGLAIEGLVRHHEIDALKYNVEVDDALDLKPILTPNLKLRQMLVELRKSGKVDRLWLITNAYKNHALRVISLLGIGDLFDGLTFCDYSQIPIICKPMVKYFENALTVSGVDYTNAIAKKKQLFIDDSELNVKAALQFGIGTVLHYVELDDEYEKLLEKKDHGDWYGEGKIIIIRNVLEIPQAVPRLFE